MVDSNLEAARSGDRRAALVAARDTLARSIDAAADAGDGTVAQLVAQYRMVLADLAALDGGGEESEADAIANVVALRLADSIPSASARRGGGSRSG